MEDRSPRAEDHEPPEQWVEVSDADGRTWRVDVGFLGSSWRCIWGEGCLGIGDEPAPERQEGCCSVGAQLLDEAEAQTVVALAATLDPERFEQHGAAAELGVVVAGEVPATRVVDGACIFLNRPGFAGGVGCALHLGALDDGEDPSDWKPSVCWQLPLKVDRPAHDTASPVVLRRWRRQDWGPGGATMAWCCTEGSLAYRGGVPVVESMASELGALLGEAGLAEVLRRME